MKKLLSFCDDPWSMGKFGEAGIECFLDELNFDGIELMKWDSPDKAVLPANRVIGRHLLFWPTWLDFWQWNRAELLRQFGSEAEWRNYYMAATPEEFVNARRQELLDADQSGAKYVVYHVSHVQLEHCRNGQYTYSDSEIVKAFSDFINRVVDDLPISVTVLLENHWYPGMTFLDTGLCEVLLDNIRYHKLGFVLDTSHLMNTRQDLQNEEDAADYILTVLSRLSPRVKEAIRAIHLNCSISAEAHSREAADHSYASFQEQLIASMSYVSKLDPHKPISSSSFRNVIHEVKPEFLVYELAYQSEDELRSAVTSQDRVLGGVR